MPVKGAKVSEARSVRYEIEVEIAAPRERVWRALTAETGDWWLPDFRMVAGTRGPVVEAWPGGRVYESAGEGRPGLLWFTVVELAAPESLQLEGPLTAAYGGPATTQLHFRLRETERDGRPVTLLAVTDSLFGHVPDKLVDSLHGGWRLLLGDGLRAWCERAS